MQFTKRLIFMSDVKSWNCKESSICSIDVVTQEDGRKERGNSVEGNNRSGENTTKEEEGNKNSRPEISSDALRSYGLINFETCWKPVRRREPQASGILPQIPVAQECSAFLRTCLQTRTTISHARICNNDATVMLAIVEDYRFPPRRYANFGSARAHS